MDDSSLYYTTTSTQADTTGGLLGLVLYVALVVLLVASMWKLFAKAGKPGWAALIPIYNTIVLIEITGRPLWWFVLLLIPFVNIVFLVILMNDLSKSFGRGVGTTLLLIFLPFIAFPMLAFGSASYGGPAAAGSTPVQV